MKGPRFKACLAALLSIIFPAIFEGANNPAATSAKASRQAPAGTTIQLQTVASSLTSPVFATHAGDGSNRLFIVEQGGMIKVLQPGSSVPTVFLNIGTRISTGGERGLLGLAFHPFYRNNRRFFVYYTRSGDGALQIAEYRASAANPDIADTAEIVILTIPHPNFSNHNGGTILFGPDGYLYAGPGDGGSGNDPNNNAQNINSLLGKILRIDIDHPNGVIPYSSPPTNPFFGATPGRDEIYALGMRNPFRFSFDRETGELYVGDVGQNRWEEVDKITLGGNYGWRVFEGMHCTGNDPGCDASSPCNISGFTCPILEYSSASPSPRCSVTGGYVYRGPISTLPAGAYIYADFCTGEIFMHHNGAQDVLLDTPMNISSFGEDEAGELYVVDIGGSVQRIVNPTAPCSFTIGPESQSFSASGGSGDLAVTAPSNCAWTAVSNDSWIMVTAGASGTGAGAVSYNVESNAGSTTRSGAITIAGQTFTVFQGVEFFDVPVTNIFYTEIGKLSARGVTTGCGGGNYCPSQAVTREEMAAFIMRALGELNPPPPTMQRFTDVPPTNQFYAFIDRLAELMITQGCTQTMYCPTGQVTRQQMAAFLMRTLGELSPDVPSQPRFSDVPVTNPFAGFIDQLAIRGITLGCGVSNYCPLSSVTRAQMAAFLVRAFNL
jgi:glucose/arabinose dehydrogenase